MRYIIQPLTPWAAKKLNEGSDKIRSSEYITSKKSAKEYITRLLKKYENEENITALEMLRRKYLTFLRSQFMKYYENDKDAQLLYLNYWIETHKQLKIINKEINANLGYIIIEIEVNSQYRGKNNPYEMPTNYLKMTMEEEYKKILPDMNLYTNCAYWYRLFTETKIQLLE